MTIDEAIKHAEEVAEEHESDLKVYKNLGEDRLLFKKEENNCKECGEQHRQLAEWLKELKQLREQTRWIPVSGQGMKDISDVLTVSFDSGLKDESALCVARNYMGKTIMLKMELGEQADILYHLLTEQMAKAEIKSESEETE